MMNNASPEAVTELILQIFKTNGRLLLSGDRLVEPLGLTSARWQVMGAIADADRSHPVVQLARIMGVSRQAVQRVVNDLESAGLVAFKTNPFHKKAQLVELTEQGHLLFRRAIKLQRPWAADLALGLTETTVRTAFEVLGMLINRLDVESRR